MLRMGTVTTQQTAVSRGDKVESATGRVQDEVWGSFVWDLPHRVDVHYFMHLHGAQTACCFRVCC